MGPSVVPIACQDEIRCETTVARHLPSVQRPPVQPSCCNDSGRKVGAGFDRRSTIRRWPTTAPSPSCRRRPGTGRTARMSTGANLAYEDLATTIGRCGDQKAESGKKLAR